MTLSEILVNSHFSTDETISNELAVNTANRAIALINTECKTLFPKFENYNDEYNYMPSNWLFTLLSPYISYTIKMNDTSLSEADRYLEAFYKALNNFKDNIGSLIDSYDETDPESGISPTLVETEGFGGVYQIDTANAVNVGWFGDNGNGGDW